MQYCDLKAHRLSLRKLVQKITIKVINTVYVYSTIYSLLNQIKAFLSWGCPSWGCSALKLFYGGEVMRLHTFDGAKS